MSRSPFALSEVEGRRSAKPATRLFVLAVLLVATQAAALNQGLGHVPENVRRDSPLATTQGYFQSAHAGDYATAAHYLQLDQFSAAEQLTQGPRLARRLKFVLDRKLPLDVTKLSSENSGAAVQELGGIALDRQTIPIRLRRIDDAWVFSDETVRGIDRLYDEFGPPLGESLPELLFHHSLWGIEPWQWLGLLAVLALAIIVSLLIEKALLAVGVRMTKLTAFAWDDAVIESGRGPARVPFFCAIVAGGTRFLLMPTPAQRVIDTLVRSLIIVAVSWFLLRFLRRAAALLSSRVAEGGVAAGKARGLQTQLSVLNRVFEIAIYVIGAALLLVQFEAVRNVGVSLLASAGIAGLVIGLAAQKSIGALLAGIQLSVTQPIRIGDTVSIEGEVGAVEEITLTYVVVRIWDMRRLVIPVQYFLDNRFQNWSRRESELLGTVLIDADFTVDVGKLRDELSHVLGADGAKLWDGKVAKLEVVESKERTVQLRVLVSAHADNLWELRCLIRERLVTLMRRNPQWLPRARIDAPGELGPRTEGE